MQVANYKTQYVESTLLENQTYEKKKNNTKLNFISIKNVIKGRQCIVMPTTTTTTTTAAAAPTTTTTTYSCYNTNFHKDIPLEQQYYRIGVEVAGGDDAAVAVAVDDDDDICTKPRNRYNQTVTTTTKQTANVNYKCTTQANYNNIQNNNSGNKLLNSIISILHCRQLKTKQQQQQQSGHLQQTLYTHHSITSQSQTTMSPTPTPPPPSYPAQSLQLRNFFNHHYRFIDLSQDLIKIIFSALLPYLLIGTLLLQPWLAQASCRDEPSRSCEAICRPIWSQDNYLSTMRIHPHNHTLEPFQANDYNCSIRALVLLPDDDMYLASLRRVVPILKVAVQQIHASGLLPTYIEFDWMPQDDKCDAAFATVKAMDGIVKNCAHVVFGPVCDYSLAAVGRIAKYFNSHGTPLITVGGSTFDFEKPKTKCTDEFYMLLRTGMLSFETLSELTISVMKRNNWSRSIFFYDRDGQRNVAGLHTCYLMMTSLGQQMRKENMTFAQYPVTAKLMNRTEEMVREIGNKHSG